MVESCYSPWLINVVVIWIVSTRLPYLVTLEGPARHAGAAHARHAPVLYLLNHPYRTCTFLNHPYRTFMFLNHPYSTIYIGRARVGRARVGPAGVGPAGAGPAGVGPAGVGPVQCSASMGSIQAIFRVQI